MGFWSEVDMEIRSRMNKFKTSYDYEKEDTIGGQQRKDMVKAKRNKVE